MVGRGGGLNGPERSKLEQGRFLLAANEACMAIF